MMVRNFLIALVLGLGSGLVALQALAHTIS